MTSLRKKFLVKKVPSPGGKSPKGGKKYVTKEAKRRKNIIFR